MHTARCMRLSLAFTQASRQAREEAAVTNPITLSRNNSDLFQQPKDPAGPCLVTLEAEVCTQPVK